MDWSKFADALSIVADIYFGSYFFNKIDFKQSWKMNTFNTVMTIMWTIFAAINLSIL